MGEEEHRGEVRKHKAHKPDSGCIIRCETKYDEENPHSHRWQAAQQARSETRVPYGELKNTDPIVIACEKRLSRLRSGKAFAGGRTWKDRSGRTKGRLKPFGETWWPFYHNAHHIIPVSTLWGAIEKVADAAAPNSGHMLNIIIGILLKEPYNLNNQPNMIVLPTKYEDSIRLGLPQHMEENWRDHPKYRKKIITIVNAQFPPKFQSLAAAVRSKKHLKNETEPKVRDLLEGISKATYEAIIAVGAATAKREDDVNLDTVSSEILSFAKKILAS